MGSKRRGRSIDFAKLGILK
jgi:hypothetical protein